MTTRSHVLSTLMAGGQALLDLEGAPSLWAQVATPSLVREEMRLQFWCSILMVIWANERISLPQW